MHIFQIHVCQYYNPNDILCLLKQHGLFLAGFCFHLKKWTLLVSLVCEFVVKSFVNLISSRWERLLPVDCFFPSIPKQSSAIEACTRKHRHIQTGKVKGNFFFFFLDG